MRLGAATSVLFAFVACNENLPSPSGDGGSKLPAARQSDAGSRLYAAGQDSDRDLYGFGFAVSELPQDTGFVAAPRPAIGVPAAPIFEITGPSIEDDVVIDARGSVWRATNPAQKESVGFIRSDDFAKMRSLQGAASSAELVARQYTCKDCGVVTARMFMAESGAPREVVLGTSGGITQRRACPEAETLLKWLRAISRLVRR